MKRRDTSRWYRAVPAASPSHRQRDECRQTAAAGRHADGSLCSPSSAQTDDCLLRTTTTAACDSTTTRHEPLVSLSLFLTYMILCMLELY